MARRVLCLQYQRLIVGGELPCSKEEAATLAAIQLRVDEEWPDYADEDDDDDAMTTEALHAGGDYDHQTLLNHNGPCTGGSSSGRTAGRRQRPGGAVASMPAVYRQNQRAKLTSSRRRGQLTAARASTLAGRCIDGENGVRSCFRLPDGAMAKCLPPDYRSSRSVRQLIEVSVLFTSSVYRFRCHLNARRILCSVPDCACGASVPDRQN